MPRTSASLGDHLVVGAFFIFMLNGKKIIAWLENNKWRILAKNLVYIEGMNPDGSLNNDAHNYFNDLRLIVRERGEIDGCWVATTEPGRYYTQNPMNKGGAARIAFGNYKDAWAIGKHHNQDALVQVGAITVHRDLNKDGFRVGDKLDTGNYFGINQHTTSNAPTEVGRWSAGCCVGQSPVGHAKFMQMCRDMGRRYFDTTIIAGDSFTTWKP